MSLDFSAIKQVRNFEGQFVREETPKTQIVLHHTVSGEGAEGDLSWWKQTRSRIATAIVIDRDGTIYQCFSTKYWAYHIGPVSSSFRTIDQPYRKCDPNTIGVELDSWGPLLKQDGKYFPARWSPEKKRYEPWFRAGEVWADKVVEYERPFRGFKYYEKYTKKQLQSLEELIRYWNQYWKIPVDYNPGMWELSSAALIGKPGIYTHVSYRSDKSDCHPQAELIKMLKNIKTV